MATNNSINSSNPTLQVINSSIGTLVTCSTTIPADNSIPQQGTEGTEVLTATITPKSSTSTLRIIFSAQVAQGSSGTLIGVALFQDATANALAAKMVGANNSGDRVLYLEHIMTSGTTSSTTFKIKVGGSSGTDYVNGRSTGQLMGGVSATSLIIIEYL
jgi:hypothetical protein